MQYIIQNETLRITTDTKGAELVSVKFKDKEMLWQNQNGGWSGHAPMLFPVCGHFGFIHKGKEYPMPAHGFVRKMEFLLQEKSENSISYSLSSNEKTKEMYPFDFQLIVSYKIENSAILLSCKIKNNDKETMLFALGGHESFMLDLPLDSYKLVFPMEERLIHYEHDDDGYLTGKTIDFGTSNEYAFSENDLLHDETIIFKGINSGKVKLCKKTGEEVFDIQFKDFKNLLLWRPENSQMVCIEPWLNLPDELGNKQEFSEKEGVDRIPAYGEKTFERRIEYK